jgi:hypothetical protein
MSKVVGLPNNSYKPITNRAWVRPRFVNYNNGCTKLAAASDRVDQLLAHSRYFFLGTPASSTAKTGRHDIAEGGVKYQKSIYQSKSLNCIGGIMVSVLTSSGVDLGFGPKLGQTRLLNWYLLLLRLAHSIKEKKQRLDGSESE